MSDARASRVGAWLLGGGLVGSLLVLTGAIVQVLRAGTDPANTSAPGYLPLAWSAAAVLLAVIVGSLFVRRADLRLATGFPWLVGAVSFLVSWGAWLALWLGNTDLGAWIYRGLRVPQGQIQFWDASLVLQSIDCASWGFDVWVDNNGCLQDASIYGPGTLWLQWVPFVSNANVHAIGVLMMAVSSLALVLLARWSSGLGQLVLLVAAVGAPWTLMLERGNLDAAVLWVAVAVVALVMRWPRLWAWWVAAALIWVLGTWKYYPFAMGLMLVPALRVRRGWTVLAGFAVASLAFVALTWSNLQFSMSSNTAMIDYGDYVVLGRVPVVARMLGTAVGAGGVQFGDVLVFGLALLAVVWGVGFGLLVRHVAVGASMLAIAGSVLFIASVVYAGFGWGYKATFLLLAVPLLSAYLRSPSRWVVVSALMVLALIGIDAVVVWNTVLATLAGVVAAGFALGASAVLLGRHLVGHRTALQG